MARWWLLERHRLCHEPGCLQPQRPEPAFPLLWLDERVALCGEAGSGQRAEGQTEHIAAGLASFCLGRDEGTRGTRLAAPWPRLLPAAALCSRTMSNSGSPTSKPMRLCCSAVATCCGFTIRRRAAHPVALCAPAGHWDLSLLSRARPNDPSPLRPQCLRAKGPDPPVGWECRATEGTTAHNRCLCEGRRALARP